MFIFFLEQLNLCSFCSLSSWLFGGQNYVLGQKAGHGSFKCHLWWWMLHFRFFEILPSLLSGRNHGSCCSWNCVLGKIFQAENLAVTGILLAFYRFFLFTKSLWPLTEDYQSLKENWDWFIEIPTPLTVFFYNACCNTFLSSGNCKSCQR